ERQQRVPARQELRVLAVLLEQRDRLVHRRGPFVVEGRRDHRPPPSARSADPTPPPGPAPSERSGRAGPAPWIARQTRSGVIGRSMSVMPRCDSASITAFTTAGGDAIVPVSPTPFTPSSFVVEGVSIRPSSMAGISDAAGIA